MPPTPTKTKSLGRPLLALMAPRKDRCLIPSHSGSESTFSLFAKSRIVAELRSSSGVDFPGGQGEPANRDTRLRPARFVVRRVVYIAVSILLPLTSQLNQ